MKRFSTVLWVLLAFAVLACDTHRAFAQGIESAQLNGTVTDSSGREIVGASISARHTATDDGLQRQRRMPAAFYAIANIPPGTYELRATSQLDLPTTRRRELR
jgi:hypothetical protein